MQEGGIRTFCLPHPLTWVISSHLLLTWIFHAGSPGSQALRLRVNHTTSFLQASSLQKEGWGTSEPTQTSPPHMRVCVCMCIPLVLFLWRTLRHSGFRTSANCIGNSQTVRPRLRRLRTQTYRSTRPGDLVFYGAQLGELSETVLFPSLMEAWDTEES